MSTNRIEIKIANRIYPINVSEEDELMIESCVGRISAALKQLEEKYEVIDKQDALAMVTIQLALSEAKLKREIENNEDIITERIFRLMQMIDHK